MMDVILEDIRRLQAINENQAARIRFLLEHITNGTDPEWIIALWVGYVRDHPFPE